MKTRIIIAVAIIGLLAILMFVPLSESDYGEIAVLIGLLAIFVCLYRYIRNKPLIPSFLKKLDLKQMDTRIIMAVIISLSAIICTYLYTQNTPLNQCIESMIANGRTPENAMLICMRLSSGR